MKSRKTSYSLSKLNVKKNDFHQNSQRSFKRKHSKRVNQSQIERIDLNTPIQNSHHEAVLNEYYGTTKNRFRTVDDNNNLLENSKMIGKAKISNEIQSKMRRVIDNHEFDSDINIQNIVLEESDVDQEFEDKIMENKELLKVQREKQHSTQPHQKLQKEIGQFSERKQTKNLSLVKNPIEKHIKKNKTKSLLPAISSSSSKILNLIEQRFDKNRPKNQSQRQILKLENMPLLPNIRQHHHDHVYHHQFNHTNSVDERKIQASKNYIHPSKDERFKRKFTEVQQKKEERKIAQLKLESKIQQLKSKIAQRTSANVSKSRILEKNIVYPLKRKHTRYASHSVFDGIQDFLSNPHQNNTKSQRKFLKLYQKIGQDEKDFEKEKRSLQKRIQKISAKIESLRTNKKDQTTTHIQQKQQLPRPTSSGSSPKKDLDSQLGALEWRRLEENRISKSSFQNELKYVKSLEQKGQNNLIEYVQNQKILHELKMIKKTQQILSKAPPKQYFNLKVEKYTSI